MRNVINELLLNTASDWLAADAEPIRNPFIRIGAVPSVFLPRTWPAYNCTAYL